MVATIDIQSVSNFKPSEGRSYNAGELLTDQKRHVAVDTLGLTLVVAVLSACSQDN